MEKINGYKNELSLEIINKLQDIIPECFENGCLVLEKLKSIVGLETKDDNDYSFSWIGKNDAIRDANLPTTSTLLPVKEKSIEWSTTKNLYIEGDNYQVLKTLMKTYHNQVKLIYIDPPYNTGNDFVYRDNFDDKKNDYIKESHQEFKSNPETSGRYHTNWLNMMYSRLKIARELLKDDGYIFISIDDNEQANLKKICDEIFYSENFVNCIAIEMSPSSGVKRSHKDLMFIKNKEYILVYKKSEQARLKPLYDEWSQYDKHYSIFYNGSQYCPLSEKISNLSSNYSKLKSDYYLIFDDVKKYIIKNAENIYRTHDASKWAIDNVEESLCVYNGERTIYKVFNPENNAEYELLIKIADNKYNRLEPLSWNVTDGDIKTLRGDLWLDFDKDMGNVSKEGEIPYPNGKKPLRLLRDIIQSTTNDNDIILDFFSGSATTGHAVFDLNFKEKTNRNFILVQLDEIIDYSDKDNRKYYEKYGFKTVCDIGEKRLKKSIDELKREIEENVLLNQYKFDLGYKVFKLASTNIVQWDPTLRHNETTLLDLLEVIKEGRTNLDVAYEIMLKYGVFNMPLEEIKVNGKTVYSVGSNYMIISLNDEITELDVESIAKLQPKAVVFKESGFVDDNAKINADHTFKRLGIDNVKCI